VARTSKFASRIVRGLVVSYQLTSMGWNGSSVPRASRTTMFLALTSCRSTHTGTTSVRSHGSSLKSTVLDPVAGGWTLILDAIACIAVSRRRVALASDVLTRFSCDS
jgi:hypothetical protein